MRVGQDPKKMHSQYFHVSKLHFVAPDTDVVYVPGIHSVT